MKCELIT